MQDKNNRFKSIKFKNDIASDDHLKVGDIDKIIDRLESSIPFPYPPNPKKLMEELSDADRAELESEPKRCDICGNDPLIEEILEENSCMVEYRVRCSKCSNTTQKFPMLELAVLRWNMESVK